MIILNVMNSVFRKNEDGVTTCEDETTRILVHSEDILQVYEEHSKRDTHTYAIIKSPSGSPNKYRIIESVDKVQELINSEHTIMSWG